MAATETCLGIAVYHRIRALFKPCDKTPFSFDIRYAIHLNELLHSVRWTVRELSATGYHVTKELARAGGDRNIAGLLQQPAKQHSYESGMLATIAASQTLSATDLVFRAASCGTLFLSRVSFFESLPYVRSNDKIGPSTQARFREMVWEALRLREPKVVFCAWQDKIPDCF